MKKIIKYLAAFFGIIGVLLLGAFIFIKVKYPPEKVKALVLEQVKEKLHREARVEDVSISLFKGIELSGFKLSERPDFSQGSFVECRSFRLGFSLMTILKGKLVLSQVLLDAPKIHVVRMPDGKTFNFSDLAGTGAPESKTSASPEAKAPPSKAVTGAAGVAAGLLVENIKIREGEVQFIDRAPNGYDVGLQDLNFSVSGFSLIRPFKTALSTQINLKQKRKALSAKVNLAGKVSIAGKGRVELEKVALASGKTVLEVGGTVDDLLAEPQADLRIQLKSFDPATVAFFAELPAVAQGMGLSADLKIKGTQTNIQGTGVVNIDVAGLKGTINLSDLAYKQGQEPYVRVAAGLENVQPSKALPVKDVSVSGSLGGQIKAEGTLSHLSASVDIDATGLDIKYADLLKKNSGIPCKLLVKADVLKQDTADLHQLGVVFGPLNLSASGVVSGLAKAAPHVNLNVNLSPLSLGELASMVGSVAAYKPQGAVSASLRVSGTQDNPSLEGTVQMKEVSAEAMPGVPISGLNAVIQMKANSLSMPSLSGKLVGSPFKMNLSVLDFKAPHVVFNGNLEKLDVGKILAALPKSAPAKAPPAPVPPQAVKAAGAQGPLIPFSLKANFAVGEITHPNYEGRSLKLQCDLSGRGSDMSALKGTSSLTLGEGVIHNIPLVSALAAIVDPNLSRLAYDSIIARMNFDNGKMNLTQGDLNGQISVVTTGVYTFANSGLDFLVKVRIPKGQVAPVIAQYASVGGDVPVDLGLGGTLDKPKYSLKVTEMAKQRAKQEIKQKAGELLQEGLKNILKF